jgi:hypothetical protein
MGNSYTYNYSVSKELLKPNAIHSLHTYLLENTKVVRYNSNKVEFVVSISTFFFIEEQCIIRYIINKENSNFLISVEYKKSLQFLIFFIIASALFSTFSVSFFLWFCGICMILFYSIRMVYIHIFISNIKSQITSMYSDEEILSEKQKQWIENPHVCPACGTEINKYTIHCSECGLFIKHLPPVSRFSLSENLDAYNLNYVITDEKD